MPYKKERTDPDILRTKAAVLEALELNRIEVAEALQEQEDLVLLARELECSWPAIAMAAGMSLYIAEKYKSRDPRKSA